MVSVIVPCKNHAQELHECLTGLSRMKCDPPFEIIVVDSASDEKVFSVAQEFPNARIIRSRENLDPARARNLGVSRAVGEYLAFIDADCVPAPEWLQTAAEALHSGSMMVGGPVSDAVPRHPIAVTDNILQFVDLSAHRPEGVVGVLPACNLAVRREAFHTAGGFPNAPYIEDVLFTSRVAALWPEKCRFVPGMRVSHKGRRTLKGLWNHQVRFGRQRGAYGFRITKRQRFLGRFRFTVPLVVLKRSIYIFSRIILWNPKRLAVYIALTPLILLGLTGWAIGFRRGCTAPLKNRPDRNQQEKGINR